MNYRKFIIRNYRAITGPLEINLEKNSLMPIIGVNECGKTTILHSIFAFDCFNDELNDNGRHLKDIANLYRTSSGAATITAEIVSSKEEFREFLDELQEDEDDEDIIRDIKSYKRKIREGLSTFTITRHLKDDLYTIESEQFSNHDFNDILARNLIQYRLPFILYFDDFRDSLDEKIEIKEENRESTSGWLAIIEQLFQQTNKDYSVFNLPELEERNRKSVLANVKRRLNNTLTKEWQKFRLDETDALKLSIEYEEEIGPNDVKRSFLKFDVIETDSEGNEHYFFIRDRSKGFFWFFNFVMKLEFNPKVVESHDSNTIYLLDEPGSYLHASAQSNLCKKLRQLSEVNKVLYCTHSHYLLDPDVIPFSNIRVADKNDRGDISLIPIYEHKGDILERRSAFQPVIDALQIKPFLLDLNHNRIIITEGIHDYYALEFFKEDRAVNILPSVGADSIQFYVSLMIAWRVPFRALWDNDDAGRTALRKAQEHFGDEITQEHFHLLPLDKRQAGNRILQNLFVGADIRMIKDELKLPSNASFQKTLTSLFYSSARNSIARKISHQTRKNFDTLFEQLKFS